MSRSAPPPLAQFVDSGWALFVDFDGTLVELAARPDGIAVPHELSGLLLELEQAFGGALAILTGRSLADLDSYLADVKLPAAGQHGAEFRLGARHQTQTMKADALAAMRPAIEAFAARHAGMLVEDKGASIALHYRGAATAEAVIANQVDAWVAASHGALERLEGKMLQEIRLAGVDKGEALRKFLEAAVFIGRQPLVLGDDVTDEAAFAVAQGLNGAAIKVGEGSSCARWGLESPQAVRTWLAQAVG